MKRLFKVCLYQELIVYAEDVEKAMFLFTENIDRDNGCIDHLVAMETDCVPPDWQDSIPWGAEDNRTCNQILEHNKALNSDG